MFTKKIYPAVISIFLLLSIMAVSCTPAAAPTPTASPTPTTTLPGGPGGGAVINSDSITTGTIVAIRSNLSPGYPAQIDLEIQTSTNVGSLPNPTKDKIGTVITCNTDQDVSALKVGQVITGNIKYVGDVPKPGITLYISNIKTS